MLTNAGWLYLDQIIRAVVVLAAFGAVARHLGPGDYGVLSYALAYPGVFLPLAVLGLDYVVVRDLVRHPAEQTGTLATAAVMRIGASLLGVLAALAGLLVVPIDEPARPLLIITVGSLLAQPFLLLDYWFQSRIESRYSAWARMAASVSANGLRLVFAFQGAPLVWFAWTGVIEAAVYAVGLVLAYRGNGGRLPRPWGEFDRNIARRLWLAAWPLLLADIAMTGFLRADQLLLSHLAGPEQLGRYAAAFRLADAAEFFVLALINSYFPRLVALHVEGEAGFALGLQRMWRWVTLLSVTIALALTVGAPWLVRFILGAQFREAADVLMVLAWANVFVSQIAVRGKWFLLEHLQKYSLVIFVAGAGLHLAGVWWWAPGHGASGVAVSFLIAQASMVLVVPALFPRIRGAVTLALRSFVPLRR